MEKLYEALQRCDQSNLTKVEMEEIEKKAMNCGSGSMVQKS